MTTNIMYLSKEIQNICDKYLEDYREREEEKNKIYFTVLYFIHSAPHLSNLFLNWIELHNYEKYLLNIQMKFILSNNANIIYPPLIRAFEYWNMIQNVYGAPGFNENPLKCQLRADTDKDLVQMVLAMEVVVTQIHLKRELCQELLSYNEPVNILYNYKWQLLFKSVNRNRSVLTRKKNKPAEVSEQREQNTSTTDLNGCGDTSWLLELD